MVRPVYINTRTLKAQLTGVQRYTLELARRLQGRILPIVPPNYLASGPLGHLWEQTALMRATRDGCLFSPGTSGPLFHPRQVVTVHDLVVYDHPEGFRKEFVVWYKFLLPRLLRRARRIIAVSAFTRDRLLEVLKLPREKVVVIPNGVDHSRFFPRSQDLVAEKLKNLGVPVGNYVLTLSALNKRKNLSRLLKAWNRILPELPEEIWLVVVGAKVNTKVFEEFALPDNIPRVLFLGYVNDAHVPYLYNGALAFVYISLYEGFGLPPLESMASGTPVIVANSSSLPEVVGDAAVLVDPYDIESISWEVRRVIEDLSLREELRRRGLERAKRFSWDEAAELTWKVLQEVAQEG